MYKVEADFALNRWPKSMRNCVRVNIKETYYYKPIYMHGDDNCILRLSPPTWRIFRKNVLGRDVHVICKMLPSCASNVTLEIRDYSRLFARFAPFFPFPPSNLISVAYLWRANVVTLRGNIKFSRSLFALPRTTSLYTFYVRAIKYHLAIDESINVQGNLNHPKPLVPPIHSNCNPL